MSKFKIPKISENSHPSKIPETFHGKFPKFPETFRPFASLVPPRQILVLGEIYVKCLNLNFDDNCPFDADSLLILQLLRLACLVFRPKVNLSAGWKLKSAHLPPPSVQCS